MYIINVLIRQFSLTSCSLCLSSVPISSSASRSRITIPDMWQTNFKLCREKAKLQFYILAFIPFQITERETANKFQKVFYSSQILRCVEGNLLYHDISTEGSPFISRDDRETINDWRWNCCISKRRDILI